MCTHTDIHTRPISSSLENGDPGLISCQKQKLTSVGEDAEKLEPLYTLGKNVRWYGCYGKQFLKKLEIELPNNPAIPLLII